MKIMFSKILRIRRCFMTGRKITLLLVRINIFGIYERIQVIFKYVSIIAPSLYNYAL